MRLDESDIYKQIFAGLSGELYARVILALPDVPPKNTAAFRKKVMRMEAYEIVRIGTILAVKEAVDQGQPLEDILMGLYLAGVNTGLFLSSTILGENDVSQDDSAAAN